ncbi:MAG: DUF4292 domain-containing protein [Paludibacteraceae bacterium]|nr:DUF4292 domain-containing protein [Paludibacteraceae bacterium]
MKYAHHIVMLAFVLASLASCKTTKSVASALPNGQPAKPLSLDNIKVCDPKIETADFSNITVAFNVNGSSMSTRASMRIIKDSIVQISIQPMLGIEVARINLTKKGFLLLDKINNRYFTADYDSLLTKINLQASFYDLQALLLNKMFILAEPPSPADAMIPKLKKSLYYDGIILRSKPSTGIATEFMLDKDSQIKLTTISLPTVVLRCFYSSFTQQDEIVFPFKYRLMLINGPQINEAEITVNSVEFNKKVKINTVDLSDYKRVDKIEQIIPN